MPAPLPPQAPLPTIDELVTMGIHGITPEWVRDIRAALAGS